MLRRWLRHLALALLAYVVGVLIVAASLDQPYPWVVIRAIYDTTTLFAPLALLALVAVQVIRKKSVRVPLAAVVALAGVRVYATHVEPRLLQVREVRIVTDKITRPLRIAHISDIQSDGVGAYEAGVLARLAALQPDLVIHTGDLLQTQDLAKVDGELAKIEPMLEAIDAPLGRWHVTGDTDWRITDRYPTFAGFTVLDDAGVTLRHGEDRIRLYGVSVRPARRPGDAAKAIAAWRAEDPDAFNIVFAHPPDYVLGLEDEPVDLCLAGHTHGGQIRVPFYGPPVTATAVPRELARGFHAVGETWLNTSAGIGAEHVHGMPSIRINCPPELTIITLVPASPASSDHAVLDHAVGHADDHLP